MKLTKYIITLAVSMLLIFACSNPSLVEGSGLSSDNGTTYVVTGSEQVELIVGLKATDRSLSRVAAEVEAAVNSVVLSSSRGGLVSFERVHDVAGLVGDISANSRTSRESIIQAAYDSLSTEVEKAIYRDFQFRVHKDLVGKVMAELAGRADIDFVQENYLYDYDYQPNDPQYTNGKLYGMKTTFTDKAWNITTGSPDVVVAVIDGGVEKTHPDLKNNIWSGPGGIWGYDFSDNDNDPSPGTSDHGTHVAGTIAAVGNNGIGVIGVAPNVKIMALKIFPNAKSTVCANAIRYAIDNGARVMNNSWGSKTRRPSDPTIEKAIEYAHAKGAVIVFSAGNNNDDAKHYYAKNHPDTIVVASVDRNNKKSSFSNYGTVVDIAAPGSSIYSTSNNGGYKTKSGTSMAAPHVSGLAALILSKNPHFTNEKVREVMKSTATKITSNPYIGVGVMNSYAALNGGGNTGGDKIAPSIPTGLKSTAVGETTATLAWSASTDNVAVTGYKLYIDGLYSQTVRGLDVVLSGLKAQTTYSFALTAVDAAGNESAKSQAISVTTKTGTTGGDKEAPSKPAFLKAGAVTETTIALSWNASTDNVAVTGYKLYKDGVYSETVKTTSATVTGLKAKTTYSFTVTAVDAAGNESAQSSALSVTTKDGGSTGGVAEWKTGVSYKVGDQVTYKGATYKCRMAHNSLAGWTPVNVPALWSKL